MAIPNDLRYKNNPDKLNELTRLIIDSRVLHYGEEHIQNRINTKILEILNDLKSEQDSHKPF